MNDSIPPRQGVKKSEFLLRRWDLQTLRKYRDLAEPKLRGSSQNQPIYLPSVRTPRPNPVVSQIKVQ